MNIQVGDITRTTVDCIINPANGLGVMHKGVSKALYREGGPEVQNSAKEACFKNGLYKPGQAYMGSSGFLSQRGIKAVCHAVLIYRQPEKTKLESIGKSLESSILLLKEQGYKSFSVPALGLEPRNINAAQSALHMIQALHKYNKDFEINVIDINEEFIKTFRILYEPFGK
jgi:O-acetyl-ADP-ribose deacetylase (regulator of RNase III)